MLPLLYDSDMVNFTLLSISFYFLSKLCRNIIFKMLNIFVSKVDLIDKHVEGSYMNDDDQDDSNKKD